MYPVTTSALVIGGFGEGFALKTLNQSLWTGEIYVRSSLTDRSRAYKFTVFIGYGLPFLNITLESCEKLVDQSAPVLNRQGPLLLVIHFLPYSTLGLLRVYA